MKKTFNSGLHSTVYSPTHGGLPHLAVVFNQDGSVLAVQPFPSKASAELHIVKVAAEIAKANGLQMKIAQPQAA